MTKTKTAKAEGPAVRTMATHKANPNTHPKGWGAKCSAGLKAFHSDPEKQKAAAEYHKLHLEAKKKAAAYRARKREEAAAAVAAAKVAKKVTPAKKASGPKV